MSECSHVTRLLVAWGGGDPSALEELLPLVYQELGQLASSYLRRERRGHTLQTSDLVHEAYLRLVDQDRVQWRNRAHFFGIAAQHIRRILIDHARKHLAQKRGRGQSLSLEDTPLLTAEQAPELLELDAALTRLAEVSPHQARVVEMRFFGGLTAEEIAEALDISVPTVTRQWRVARAWLYRRPRPASGEDL